MKLNKKIEWLYSSITGSNLNGNYVGAAHDGYFELKKEEEKLSELKAYWEVWMIDTGKCKNYLADKDIKKVYELIEKNIREEI